MWATYLTHTDYEGKTDKVGQYALAGAQSTSAAPAGFTAMDLLGHGMSYVTGSPAYAALGPAAGTVAGALGGVALNRADKQDLPSQIIKGAACTAGAGTAGWFFGGGLGALVGNLVFGTPMLRFAPQLGLVAGSLMGLAGYLTAPAYTPSNGYGGGRG